MCQHNLYEWQDKRKLWSRCEMVISNMWKQCLSEFPLCVPVWAEAELGNIQAYEGGVEN